VVVEERNAFNAWLAEQQTFAQQQEEARNNSEGGPSLALNAEGSEPAQSVVAQ
jgi:heme/copper-type cytochrome/quinol oxidase subunit 2